MITQPRDREVVCHASAWDIDNVEDLRIKMCTRVNADDFVTVHHELGHNYYQRAYNRQPYLYLNSANDGLVENGGNRLSATGGQVAAPIGRATIAAALREGS